MNPIASLRACLLIPALAWSAAAAANDFVVTNADDSGAGSLRQAILEANATCHTSGGTHTIRFAIPGTGLHTIRPLTPLPAFLVPIAIDGYTQPGSQQNTLPEGSNARLAIELDGSLAGDSDGLALAISGTPLSYCTSRGSSISGLVINRFSQAGIQLAGCADNSSDYTYCTMYEVAIWGNYIGTDANGTQALGNGLGIEIGINVKDLVIGTDSPRSSTFMSNLISGNHGDGVWITHVADINAATGVLVRNNYIGLDAGGTHALGNAGHGIRADAASLAVQQDFIAANGGDGVNLTSTTTWYRAGSASVYASKIGIGIHGEALGNDGDGVHVDGRVAAAISGAPSDGGFASVVANNGGAGVFVDAAAGAGTSWPHVLVRDAGLRDNGGLGIDVAPLGVNPIRDDDDLLGPNENLDAPVLTSIAAGAPNGTYLPVTVTGSVHTVAQKQVGVYFYANAACDPSGHGEGERSAVVGPGASGTTDASGDFAFTAQFSAPAGSWIAASTERFSSDDGTQDLLTSEFSNCLRVPVADLIFRNGFDPPG